MTDGGLPGGELVDQLEAALDRLEGAEIEVPVLLEALEAASARIESLTHRAQVLEQRVQRANVLAAATHRELLAERDWVARQVRAVAASESWRVGHRLVQVIRGLAGRGDRGADGLTLILRRIEPTEGPIEPVDGPRRA